MADQPPTQLLLYRFPPGARFEGQLVGALERVESGGSRRIRDALFVSSDAETGELQAITLPRAGAGGIVASLLDFRLDPGKRRRATEQALAAGDAEYAESLRALGAGLEPGAALVAVLIEHGWAEAFDDAVSRTGGEALASEIVTAEKLTQLITRIHQLNVQSAG